MTRRVIALIGAPGAGKTTTGQGLAARLGCEFVDVDQLIESQEGRTIPEIFLQQGEEFFRSREQEMTLTALGDGDGPHSDDMSARSACNSDATRVVALGGGGPLNAAIAARLEQVYTVWLSVSARTASSRVGLNDTTRPLLLGNVHSQLVRMMAQRRPAYQRPADLVVAADELSVEEVVDVIMQALKN
ncbi:MAG: shikimate kinase [Cutibacterium granulosum]|uniref:shikimate kinase n=1 Tax=Cutibacterium granulosum TaxID=33011 RepID=UPI002B230BD0|nr:shikimate kinase [Cutibacterium granulosum]MEA5645711.1 shikimate kinase [Cutibacterium granulosum]